MMPAIIIGVAKSAEVRVRNGCACSSGRLLHSFVDMDRQYDPERRALAQYRLDRDRSALHLDHALRDRQTQAGPALLARIGIVDLLELAKNPFLIRIGYARPGVAHGQHELAFVYNTADLDLTLIGEFDGIPDQVKEGLRDAAHAAMRHRQVVL